MTSAFFRLLTLIALLLMPAAMIGAPAAAAMPPRHAASAAVSEHCGDSGEPAKGPEKVPAHCVSCTALPALEVPAATALAPVRTLAAPGLAERIDGIIPDIATPPPKQG